MAIDLNAILNQVGRDKGIDREVLITAVESAMLSAAKKHYGHSLNLETRFDEDSGTIELLQFKTVVEKFEDKGTQLTLEEAKEHFDSDAIIGDEFGEKLDTDVLGRIAAQTAKQVIIQKVRDAERGAIFEEYKDSKGEIVHGIIQRYERGNAIINLGRTEAILPKREQIRKERYRQGERISGMILDIDPTSRGPQIILTRSHPDFLVKLFTVEVPEIREGTIEVKNCVREAGDRAKIAVYSEDSSIDPVGACVGIKGSRVHAVVQELRGEKIDIIPWIADEPSFVARALSPAEVTKVLLDHDEKSMEIIVADDQLSYAIGRGGQNVKLASKLTGWRLDVRSATVVEEENKKARAAIEAIPNINFTNAELLFQEGYKSAKEIAEDNIESLMEIDGITAEVASEIIQNAKDHLKTLGEDSDDEQNDLDSLYLGPELKNKVLETGITNIQELASFEIEELALKASLNEIEQELLKSAIDTFFSSSKLSFEDNK